MPEHHTVHVYDDANGSDLMQPGCTCGWEGETTTDEAMADIEAAEHERDTGHQRCSHG